MSPLIDPKNPVYHLGVQSMDQTHGEFMQLVNTLGVAGKQSFIDLFDRLYEHTKKHFEAENELMKRSGFPAIREHMDEHNRVLGELSKMERRVATGNTLICRAYVREQLPDWFDLHARTMDSALAAHLKAMTLEPGPDIPVR